MVPAQCTGDDRRRDHHADPHPRRPGRRHARDRLGGRPPDDVRRRDPPLAVSVRVLPRRGGHAGLARQRTDAHARPDTPRRPPPRRQLRGVAALGGRPQDGLLPVPAPARPLSVPRGHGAAGRRGHGWRRIRAGSRGRHARAARGLTVRLTPALGPMAPSVVRSDPFGTPIRPCFPRPPTFRRSRPNPMAAVEPGTPAPTVAARPRTTRAARARTEFPFLNRELSWLEFNARVLHEARDERNPLLERTKFLAIFAGNLDEFFQVRIAGLRQQVEAGAVARAADGRTPAEQLSASRERAL